MGTVADVAVLSREEFDAIEFDAACTGDYRSAAERMSMLAATGIQTESMPRAEAFVRAGEQWLLADDPAAWTDVPAWCQMKSHKFIATNDLPSGWAFLIKRSY